MDVFKKLFVFTVFITALICVFCISSAAVDYGLEYLDPATYEDDIGLVFLLEYREEYSDDSDNRIVIPLYQIRIPDISSYDFQFYFDLLRFDITVNDIVESITFRDGSYLKNSNDQYLDLSDFLLYDLDTYSITSDYWDDVLFHAYVDGEYIEEIWAYSDLPVYLPSDSEYSSSPIFFCVSCDMWDGSVPVYPSEIPTYPARPIITDPPVTDLPLNPGNINTVLGKIFETPVDTLSQIFTATNTLYAFISVFVFYMFVRFILKPIFGGSLGSDHVRRSVDDTVDYINRGKHDD